MIHKTTIPYRTSPISLSIQGINSRTALVIVPGFNNDGRDNHFSSLTDVLSAERAVIRYDIRRPLAPQGNSFLCTTPQEEARQLGVVLQALVKYEYETIDLFCHSTGYAPGLLAALEGEHRTPIRNIIGVFSVINHNHALAWQLAQLNRTQAEAQTPGGITFSYRNKIMTMNNKFVTGFLETNPFILLQLWHGGTGFVYNPVDPISPVASVMAAAAAVDAPMVSVDVPHAFSNVHGPVVARAVETCFAKLAEKSYK